MTTTLTAPATGSRSAADRAYDQLIRDAVRGDWPTVEEVFTIIDTAARSREQFAADVTAAADRPTLKARLASAPDLAIRRAELAKEIESANGELVKIIAERQADISRLVGQLSAADADLAKARAAEGELLRSCPDLEIRERDAELGRQILHLQRKPSQLRDAKDNRLHRAAQARERARTALLESDRVARIAEAAEHVAMAAEYERQFAEAEEQLAEVRRQREELDRLKLTR